MDGGFNLSSFIPNVWKLIYVIVISLTITSYVFLSSPHLYSLSYNLLIFNIFQDLPEFFEDNMQDWMTFFRSLLQLNASTLNLTNETNENNNATVLVEQIKSQICDNASLYASKYEPEFASYLPGFVTDVWEMLLGTSAQTKYDLVSIIIIM